MLRSWLQRPLTDLNKLAVRHAIVEELVADTRLRAELSECLAVFGDLERLSGRLAGTRATTDDVRALAALAELLPDLGEAVESARGSFLRGLARPRPGLVDAAAQIARTLAPAGTAQQIQPNVSAELDAALLQQQESATWERQYLSGLRLKPGLERLRLDRTPTQGLFLEVPANTPVPPDWTRRGGLQKVERYTTAELEQHAIELAQAEAVVASEVQRIVESLREVAQGVAGEARNRARHLAAADALLSFAVVADERDWVRPRVDDDTLLHIDAGRHPVLEQSGEFQPNATHLTARGSHDQLVILTGPNMAGKSTRMRQIALIVRSPRSDLLFQLAPPRWGAWMRSTRVSGQSTT
jgi:DNA mismatch repair protein MutS